MVDIFSKSNDSKGSDSLVINGDWRRVTYESYRSVIRAGDIIDLKYELQVSNDLDYNIGWSTYIAVILDEHSYDRTDWSFIRGTKTGQNVSPQQHHDRVFKGAFYQHSGYDVSKAWFAVWARAYSTAGQPGDIITVDRKGAFLLHFRK